MYFIYSILLILISCDNEPGTYYCSNGQIMDTCGNCRNCESEDCGWNDVMDDCGECNPCGNGTTGNQCDNWNTSCIECTNPSASNYGSNGECEYNNPELWIIDLEFLTENNYCVSNNPEYNSQCSQYNNEATCNLFYESSECEWIGTFDIYTNTPIYWNNTSNQTITIYTQDTQGNYCDFTIEAGMEANCNQYDNQIACENSMCEWILSPTYNIFWDEYEETIPQGIIGVTHNYYFRACESGECGAFNTETEETFCAQINEEEKCGKIRVID